MAVRPIPRDPEGGPSWSPVDEASVGNQRPIGVSAGIQGLPGTTNVDPVYLGYAGTRAPYGSPRPVYSNVYQQRQELSRLRNEARKNPAAEAQYNSIVNQLRASGYLGPRSKPTASNVDEAWMELLKENAAAAMSVYASTPGELLYGDMSGQTPTTAGAGGGRGGGYAGPSRSVVVAAESDIRATADAVAMEMLGRGVTDEELQRIVRRTRSAERAQPQVTTSGPGMSVTEQGLTAEGRQDIVQNILAKKPEYAEFQKATTLMSWFDRALQERMQQ